MRRHLTFAATLALCAMAACADDEVTQPEQGTRAIGSAPATLAQRRGNPRAVERGQQVFRFDNFGDWRFWTDTARLNDLIETVSPVEALALGLKVDATALPPGILQTVDLNDPATTRALLGLDAVVGVTARVEGDQITRIGITCAFCHSTVDNFVAPGIGNRLDGWPNRDLQLGTILSLLPGLPEIAASLGVSEATLSGEFKSWPTGFYDARVNQDGRFAAPPTVIPPAYGLRGVGLETFTAEGPISYWNAYVAVTQMHGHGSFFDPELGIRIRVPPQEDEVKKKLPFLRQYQLSLEAPPPPPGSFDVAAAARGEVVFEGVAGCTECHSGPKLTDHGNLHEPAETGMEPTWAERGTTGAYRTTPLHGIWQHPPYFHDGSAATLREVVEHYDDVLDLGLTERQKQDLVQYLKSL